MYLSVEKIAELRKNGKNETNIFSEKKSAKKYLFPKFPNFFTDAQIKLSEL
jgi:hypothetical protein